jgi:RNA polymerase sigma-70 factor (ECF subfamily)
MQKEENQLSHWVEEYIHDLYSWAVHKVSDNETAKDLVQDTFLAAAEKISDFKGESSPKTWLFSILNHKIIDFYRKKINQTVSLEDQILSNYFDAEGNWKTEMRPHEWHEEEGHLLDDDEFQEVLRKCLETLPGVWNTCIRLKYLLDKNGDEICQELDISPTNLWQIIHRAKLQLRDCVDTNWFTN